MQRKEILEEYVSNRMIKIEKGIEEIIEKFKKEKITYAITIPMIKKELKDKNIKSNKDEIAAVLNYYKADQTLRVEYLVVCKFCKMPLKIVTSIFDPVEEECSCGMLENQLDTIYRARYYLLE